jgi:hypothetical protein
MITVFFVKSIKLNQDQVYFKKKRNVKNIIFFNACFAIFCMQ